VDGGMARGAERRAAPDVAGSSGGEEDGWEVWQSTVAEQLQLCGEFFKEIVIPKGERI